MIEEQDTSRDKRERDKPYSLWKRRLDSGRSLYYVRFRRPDGTWASPKSSGATSEREARAWARTRLGQMDDEAKGRDPGIADLGLSMGEANALFAMEWPDEGLRLINLLAATAGLRLPDVKLLKKGDIVDDLDVRLSLPRDGKGEGSCRLSARVARELRRWIATSGGDPEGLLFPGSRQGLPYEDGEIECGLSAALQGIGIGDEARRARRLSFASWRAYYDSARLLWEEQPEEFRPLVEGAEEGIYKEDGKGRIAYANVAMARMLGYGEGRELVGLRAIELQTEQSRARARKARGENRAGACDRYDASFSGKDGRTISARISTGPLLERGKRSGSLAIVSDIGNQKEAYSAKVMRIEQRLTDLVDRFPIAVCAIGTDAKIKYLNTYGNNLFSMQGGGQKSVISLRDHLAPEGRGRYDRALGAVINRGETRSLVFETVDDKRGRASSFWRFSPIREDEKIFGAYVAIIDLGMGLLETRALPDDSFYSRFPLTDRERDIADFLLAGLQYKEMASHLDLSLSTIRTHVMNLYRKMGINSREALARAARHWRDETMDEE